MLTSVTGSPLFAENAPRPEEEAFRALGDAHMSERKRLFLEVVDEVIFPGLTAHGIAFDRGREWLAH
jgi:hypothetical protein